jgi:hypothetical protein
MRRARVPTGRVTSLPRRLISLAAGSRVVCARAGVRSWVQFSRRVLLGWVGWCRIACTSTTWIYVRVHRLDPMKNLSVAPIHWLWLCTSAFCDCPNDNATCATMTLYPYTTCLPNSMMHMVNTSSSRQRRKHL